MTRRQPAGIQVTSPTSATASVADMSIAIAPADFAAAALAAFLQAHLDDLESTAPPEGRHALDISALQKSGVRLWVATDGGVIVGTVALAELVPGHEELKSMRTEPLRRGQGIASSLLDYALADARGRGVDRISLETGAMEFFAPARRLYERAGFQRCGAFGTYIDDPLSAYYTLALGS